MDPRPSVAAGRPDLAAAAVPPAADERQLVDAILRRDRKAAAELVARFSDPIHAYVRHRLSPRADLVDDVVQDVFLAALAGLAGFRGSAGLRVWLLGIARHKVESYYRERLRDPDPLDLDATEPPADDPPLDETLDRARMEARAQRVLQQLPEPYALALLWRYWEGRSAREMAEATGRTEKAVERLLARARARFRELWEETRP